jgi:thiol-disulfide isomerase/thioredoxin
MFQKIALALLVSSSLFAYDIGDSIDKKVVTQLSRQNEKVYILNFFASWCGSCKKELPILNTYAQKHAIIGINIDKDATKGQSFVEKMDLKFKVIYDSDNSMVAQFNPVGVPALYFIKNGKVLAKKFGADKHIESYISKTLKDIK